MSVMTIKDMDEHENEQYSTDFGVSYCLFCRKWGYL